MQAESHWHTMTSFLPQKQKRSECVVEAPLNGPCGVVPRRPHPPPPAGVQQQPVLQRSLPPRAPGRGGYTQYTVLPTVLPTVHQCSLDVVGTDTLSIKYYLKYTNAPWK